MKKRTAFKVGLAILVAFFFIVVFKAPEALDTVGVVIVLAIAGTTIGYQAVQAADNAFKGKYYRAELDPGAQVRGAFPARDGT
jgi:hypothetical protein